MNAPEFEVWLAYHTSAYPAVRDFLAREGEASKIHWGKVVCRCDLEYAKKVTDLMFAGDLTAPRGYSDHPQFVRTHATRLKREDDERCVVRTSRANRLDCPECEDTGLRSIIHPDITQAARQRQYDGNVPLRTMGAACTCRRGERILENWTKHMKTRLARFNAEAMIPATLPDSEILERLKALGGGVTTVLLEGGGREWVF